MRDLIGPRCAAAREHGRTPCVLLFSSFVLVLAAAGCPLDSAEPVDADCTLSELRGVLEEFAGRFSAGFGREEADAVMREVSDASPRSARLFEFTDVVMDGRRGPALAFLISRYKRDRAWLQFQRRGDLEFFEWTREEFRKIVASRLGGV